MENSKIQWTTHTFSPWTGCTKISPGCDRCYAEAWAKRSGNVQWGPHALRRRTTQDYWKQPLKWAKKVREQLELFEEGMLTLKPTRPRVFCASLADVFDNQVPEEWRHDLWRLIWDTPELDWLLLTKRPENIAARLPESWRSHWREWRHVWLGFTAEDQPHFERRWPIMREIPAAVHFCSYEPAIGSLRLLSGMNLRGLDWLICGGESGPGYREMPEHWERFIRNDCLDLGIAYFFKQFAGKKAIPNDFPIVRQFPAQQQR